MTCFYLYVQMKSLKDFKCSWINPNVDIKKGENPNFLVVTTQWYTHLRSGKRKPLFNEIFYLLLLVTTLGMFRRWVCSDIGYVQTLGMFRHWVCSDVGYVLTLGMFRHWLCLDIGYVQTLGTIRHLVYSEIRYVQTMGMFRCYVLAVNSYNQTLGMFRHR